MRTRFNKGLNYLKKNLGGIWHLNLKLQAENPLLSELIPYLGTSLCGWERLWGGTRTQRAASGPWLLSIYFSAKAQ